MHLELRSARFLAQPSTWGGSAWAGSPLLKSREPWPTALGGGARLIPSMAGGEGVGVSGLSGSDVRGVNLGLETGLKEAHQCCP
jgi:hypothetical protein